MPEVMQAWHKGSLEKSALWSIYTSLNIVGSIFCLIGLVAIGALKNRSSNDVFVAGLLFGCFTMSVACGIQCLLNLIDNKGYFSWGPTACEWEAFFHVASILTQFLSIFMIGIRNYVAVVRGYQMTLKAAVCFQIGVIALGWGGTAIFAKFSDVYLLPAGVYCLYAPLSPAMLYWFVPTMLISLLTLILAYVAIFIETRRLQRALQRLPSAAVNSTGGAERPASRIDVPARSSTPSLYAQVSTNTPSQAATGSPSALLGAQVARRSVIYVLVFLIGWGPGVLLVAWELFVGVANEYLDSLLGVNGSTHSVVVPLLYAYFNIRLRAILLSWIGRKDTLVESVHRDSKGRDSHKRLSQGNHYRVDSRNDSHRDSRRDSRQDRIKRAASPLSMPSRNSGMSPVRSDVDLTRAFSPPPSGSPYTHTATPDVGTLLRVNIDDMNTRSGASTPAPLSQRNAWVNEEDQNDRNNKKYRRLELESAAATGASNSIDPSASAPSPVDTGGSVVVVLEPLPQAAQNVHATEKSGEQREGDAQASPTSSSDGTSA